MTGSLSSIAEKFPQLNIELDLEKMHFPHKINVRKYWNKILKNAPPFSYYVDELKHSQKEREKIAEFQESISNEPFDVNKELLLYCMYL